MNGRLRGLVRALRNSLPQRLRSQISAKRVSDGPASLGQGAYVHRSVQILGRAFVRIGANSVLGQECWLNVNHRVGNVAAIEIGDHCFIGRRNFFSSGRRIEIGHYVLTANDCYFLKRSYTSPKFIIMIRNQLSSLPYALRFLPHNGILFPYKVRPA